MDQILPSEGTVPVHAWIMDFRPPQLADYTFLWLLTTLFVVLRYSSPRNLRHFPRAPLGCLRRQQHDFWPDPGPHIPA